MKLSRISIIAACLSLAMAAPLAGCAAPLASAPPASASEIIASAPTKALTAAELGFQAAVTAVGEATSAGLLKGDKAKQASALLEKAHAALLVARSAYASADQIATIAAAADVTSLVTQIGGLLKR